MEPSDEFKAWLKAHEQEIEEHFNFAVQAFHILTRCLPSPQGGNPYGGNRGGHKRA